jgi:hypothetical protein
MRKRVNPARLAEVQAFRARAFELIDANEHALDQLNLRYGERVGYRPPMLKSAAQRVAEIDQEVERLMRDYVYEIEPSQPSWFRRLFSWLLGEPW